MDRRSHVVHIQQAFTQQAATYAAAVAVSDPQRIACLIRATNPTSQHRVLDVASGPGFVAEAFAPLCAEVVGMDVTYAPLLLAEQRRTERNLTNLHFHCADAHALPFDVASFDIVVCRFAFHHFPEPDSILREMVRVCKDNGTVAVEDLVVSEDAGRAAYHNKVEYLRDTSHTKAHALSSLLQLFASTGLEVESVATSIIIQEVEAWLAAAHTPMERADNVRQMLLHDNEAEVSGIRPFHNTQGNLCFRQHTAIVVGRKLP